MEERFDAVVCNFLDFEKAMMVNLLEFSYAGLKHDFHSMEMRRNLNRALMNALSAARGFVDHLPQACNSVFGKADSRGMECTDSLRDSYDSSPGYRIFEALRNHSQHSGFPIHSISFDMQMEGDFPNMRARQSISPMLDTVEIKRNRKFKASVLKELEKLGKRLDLKQFLRAYVAGIAKAHYKFRELSEPLSELAGGELRSLSDEYGTAIGTADSAIAIHAVHLSTTGGWIDCVPLGSGLHEYWKYLASKNTHFSHDARSFIATTGRADS